MCGRIALVFVIAIILLLLLISYSFLVGTLDLRPQFSPVLQAYQPPRNHSACSPAADHRRPLRVYMYDLPRRFHVGMISHSRSSDEEDAAVTSRNMPRIPEKSWMMRQHSVEYWMMASLLYEEGEEEEEEEREGVRVTDPEMADVFFVPFFSSLSYEFNGHGHGIKETEVDRQLQADIVNFLRKSKYWQVSGGRNHVIPMHHPNAFRFNRKQVDAAILIVSDFGRYPRTVANLNKDVVAPYLHIVDSFTDDDTLDPFESRTTLLFFRGGTVRKAQGKVRAKLAKILVGYDDVHYEQGHVTTEGIETSTQAMRTSKFCLHPAGDTPSSCRLFDAIVSHCVPVIVSDQIELPYEDELDYTKFSIFFSVEDALRPEYMVDQLRQISNKRWVEMWRWLKNVSHHYEFQYPPKEEDAVNMLWRQVKHKLPAANLAVHRSPRLIVQN